jgi:hypothetical protein
MIVEPVRIEACDHQTMRSARVIWPGNEFVLWFRGPAAVVDGSVDASAFLCATLPLAMWAGSDLSVEGPVSPRLAGRIGDLQAVYRAWNPELASIDVEVDVYDGVATAVSESASFFSRGVDSTFTAAHEGARVLVFGDHLDPRHDDEVRAEEIRRARRAAACLGRQLVVVASSARTLTDQIGVDWEDALGAGLSFLAHGVAAGFGSVMVPSSDSYESVEPCGSSPLLDPLFSTERVEIVHGTISHSRLGKIRWLAEHAPETLQYLKVCYSENRADNCGRCGKCVYTMACLQAAGVLDRASEFPPTIDPDLVRGLRLPHLKARIDWAELIDELSRTGADGALRRAIVDVLEASTLSARYRTLPNGRWIPRRWTRDQRLELVLSLVLEGRLPASSAGEFADDHPLALKRSWTGGRHTYEMGAPSAGHGNALGVLLARPLPGAIPIWFTADRRLLTRGMTPRPTARVGHRVPGSRLWRRLTRPPTTTSGSHALDESTAGSPDAYLHGQDGPDRVPLYLSWHPAFDDQLLSTTPDEAHRSGYGPCILLGYLEAPPSE